MITHFTIFVFIHLLGDFFLQPAKWALNKDKAFAPLLYHCIQYTIPFIIALYALGYSLWWAAWIFVMHLAIDNRAFLVYFNTLRGEPNLPNWIYIVQDQAIHLFVLAIIFF